MEDRRRITEKIYKKGVRELFILHPLTGDCKNTELQFFYLKRPMSICKGYLREDCLP